jgi:hypothetical protein
MPRAARSMVADRIRIEDEVWEEAFASRVRSRPARTRASLAPAPRAPAARAPAPRALAPRALAPLAPVRAQAVQDPLSGLAEELYSGSSSLLGRQDAAHPPAPARRTVRIQGRGAERNLPVASARPRHRAPYEPVRFRPDRLAMWAVPLGFLLVLAAMLSAHS